MILQVNGCFSCVRIFTTFPIPYLKNKIKNENVKMEKNYAIKGVISDFIFSINLLFVW